MNTRRLGLLAGVVVVLLVVVLLLAMHRASFRMINVTSGASSASKPMGGHFSVMGSCVFATIVATTRDRWSADGNLVLTVTVKQEGSVARSCEIGRECESMVMIHSPVGTQAYEAFQGEVLLSNAQGVPRLSGTLDLEQTYTGTRTWRLEFKEVEVRDTPEPPPELVDPRSIAAHAPAILGRWQAACGLPPS